MFGILLYLCSVALLLSIVLSRMHSSGPDAKPAPGWLRTVCRLQRKDKIKPENQQNISTVPENPPLTEKQSLEQQIGLQMMTATTPVDVIGGHGTSENELSMEDEWKLIAMRIDAVMAICFAFVTIMYCMVAVIKFSYH